MASVLRTPSPRAAAVVPPPPPRLPAEGVWCCDGDDDGVPATACLPAPGGWRRMLTTAAGALLAVAIAALTGLVLGSLTAPAHATGSPGTPAAGAAAPTRPPADRARHASRRQDFWPRVGAQGLRAP
jgi:hypothetical protein